ncbi:uncharacterized protein EHS24_009499 [Apiotrichum porosum]|uniref:Ser-Thr-rich glycosyl-phosphatidyl-inositol-anchored membrane family-domain-containing protein n=1 Tax=Apiotrichum porosum TaxID=105984 RepID=A0A427XLN4_9TREE|nr:uncharacterized protein EHS24_009499 [Apiotrichum porosum]RSH79839.1 hypothetical protein EHS24_009499 [Apiotrichum porosum]
MLAHFLALAAAPLLAAAQITITQPSAALWWVDNSVNTLAWTQGTGTNPSEFTVMLANNDTSLLADRVAIFAIAYAYQYSLTVPATQWQAGTGYTIQITDTLNTSHIYSTSDTFELKAYGSAYPTNVATSASVTGSASGSGSAAGSATGSSAAAASSTAAKSGAGNKAASVVAVAAAGALAYVMA